MGPVSVVVWDMTPFEHTGGGFKEGAKRSIRTLTFDKEGRLLEDRSFADRTVLRYDLLGQVVSRKQYRGGELRFSTTHFYDAQGRAILDESKDGTGLLLSAVSYRYGDCGLLEEKTARAPTGELQKAWSFRYDDRGRLTEETAYAFATGPDGNPTKQLEYRSVVAYDEKGRKVREEFFTVPEEPDSVTRYVYGESGTLKELSEETYLAPQKVLVSRRTDHCDPAGFVTRSEEELYGPQGSKTQSSVTTYQYEFDTQGNWSRQTTLFSAEGQAPRTAQVINRTIFYHSEEPDREPVRR